MHHNAKLLLVALAAAGVLAAAVGSASATRLAASSQTTRGAWSALVFEAPAASISLTCPVTFEGTMHSRTISKAAEALVGYITRAIIDEVNCRGGRARLLVASLPWHSRYSSFSGTLPSIAAITKRIVGASWLIFVRILGIEVTCLYRSTTTEPVIGTLAREGGGVLTSDSISGTIPTTSGVTCPATGTLRGTSTSLTVLGGTERIRVTLVA